MSASKKLNWIGVDYGSKLAGTTVIAYLENDKLHCITSEKKKDADSWLISEVETLNPSHIFLDAPLSLPGAFFGHTKNYFYRECDVQTKAMSPMFLGGLTARAIKLKDTLSERHFFETYPAYLVKNILKLTESYQKRKAYNGQFDKVFGKLSGKKLFKKFNTWHEVDAAMCWLSGQRYFREEVITIGDESEGLIYI